MNRYLSVFFCLAALFTGLFSALNASAALNGEAIATVFQNQYRNTTTECSGASAAPWCSGLVAMGNRSLYSQQGVRAFYFRQDIPNPLDFLSLGDGGALVVALEKEGATSPVTPVCALPGQVDLNERSAYGCRPTGQDSHRDDTDPSSCVSTQTVDSWLSQWKQNLNSACSFSAYHSASFKLAMDVNKKTGGLFYLFLRPVNNNVFSQASNIALVYPAGDSTALSLVQKARVGLFRHFHLTVPILAFDRNKKSFVYQVNDNPPIKLNMPEAIVNSLNDRFRSQVAACPGDKPALYCSGVIMHAANDDKYFPWDYPPRRNSAGISFFYYRSDAVGNNFQIGWAGYWGMIFKTVEQQNIDRQNVDIACLYPSDVDTNAGIGDQNPLFNKAAALCQPNPNYNSGVVSGLYKSPMPHDSDPSSCRYSISMNKRVNDVPKATADELFSAWRDTQQGIEGHYRCSFSTKNANEFFAAIRATALHYFLYWNELMIRSYPNKTAADVAKLPIEAFFYQRGQSADPAIRWQKKYRDITGVADEDLPPVVEVNFDNNSNHNTPFKLHHP
ncbi:hypothetical protein M2407_005150 [Serratia sp. BIGb0234]|uniref:hypothetical protein n=1 Tax=Serratia sp. BIGb0234 TaxID=2940614 RepID=UPI002166D683|nr:hypothetical protein [Serratia sp. BIGb0234]MCS4320776.1 hypothetical protein [Serratia sp. BIGb0234]